ncbi:hypothetical protein K501DRAFT_289360 [Backusella circina FSU 941]|nr:hypothetical protein K501DRAFT_289360 [Backusella circina FSU 941]
MFTNHHHHNTDFIHPLDAVYTNKEWDNLLGQFESQPDLLKLIQICKIEEEKRFYEETRAKIKEYQVIHQLETMQAKEEEDDVLLSEKLTKQEIGLPPALSKK